MRGAHLMWKLYKLQAWCCVEVGPAPRAPTKTLTLLNELEIVNTFTTIIPHTLILSYLILILSNPYRILSYPYLILKLVTSDMILFHVILSYLVSSYLTLSCIILSYLIFSSLLFSYLILVLILSYLILSLPYLTSSQAYITLSYLTLSYVISCCVILSHVITISHYVRMTATCTQQSTQSAYQQSTRKCDMMLCSYLI